MHTAPEFSVSAVTTRDGLAALTDEWQDLVDDGSDTFGIPAVAIAWWAHVGRGRPYVVTVRERAELVAVAPLHLRRILGVRVLRWIGHGLGVVGGVVHRATHPEAVDAVWHHVAASGALVDLVDVSDEAHQVEAIHRCPELTTVAGQRDVCHVVDLGVAATFDAYLAERTGLAKSLRRLDRTLAAAGVRVRSSTTTDPTDIRAMVTDLATVSNAAEAVHPRLDLFGPSLLPFTTALLDAAAAAGNLAVSSVYLDDRPAAFDICFLAGRTLRDYFGRYDPAFGRWSPGTLSQRQVVEYAFANGLRRVDLLLGDHEYKRRWSTGSYSTADLLAAPQGRGAAAAGWQRASTTAYSAKSRLGAAVEGALHRNDRQGVAHRVGS